MARVAINALGCEPGVESHDNIPYFHVRESETHRPSTVNMENFDLTGS